MLGTRPRVRRPTNHGGWLVIPVTYPWHAHALCMTQDVVRIVYMQPGHRQESEATAVSMKSRQTIHCTHNCTKNVNIPVVASKCRVEIGWQIFTAVIQRQSLYSIYIVRRNPVQIIIQYMQYRNAPQHNTNANSRLSWLLTTSFNADDCSSYLHSTYYCQRFAAFSRSYTCRLFLS